jgi:hypothetical protein
MDGPPNAKGPAAMETRTGAKSSLREGESLTRVRACPPQNQANSSGGRRSRDKGARFERAVVRILQDHGLGAARVPLSGSAGGKFAGDLTVPCLGRDLVVEAKARANGFASLYSWLENRDALIKRDWPIAKCPWGETRASIWDKETERHRAA